MKRKYNHRHFVAGYDVNNNTFMHSKKNDASNDSRNNIFDFDQSEDDLEFDLDRYIKNKRALAEQNAKDAYEKTTGEKLIGVIDDAYLDDTPPGSPEVSEGRS